MLFYAKYTSYHTGQLMLLTDYVQCWVGFILQFHHTVQPIAGFMEVHGHRHPKFTTINIWNAEKHGRSYNIFIKQVADPPSPPPQHKHHVMAVVEL